MPVHINQFLLSHGHFSPVLVSVSFLFKACCTSQLHGFFNVILPCENLQKFLAWENWISVTLLWDQGFRTSKVCLAFVHTQIYCSICILWSSWCFVPRKWPNLIQLFLEFHQPQPSAPCFCTLAPFLTIMTVLTFLFQPSFLCRSWTLIPPVWQVRIWNPSLVYLTKYSHCPISWTSVMIIMALPSTGLTNLCTLDLSDTSVGDNGMPYVQSRTCFHLLLFHSFPSVYLSISF